MCVSSLSFVVVVQCCRKVSVIRALNILSGIAALVHCNVQFWPGLLDLCLTLTPVIDLV